MRIILNITNHKLSDNFGQCVLVPWPETTRSLEEANEDIAAIKRMVAAIERPCDVHFIAKPSYWMNLVAFYCMVHDIATFHKLEGDSLVPYFQR